MDTPDAADGIHVTKDSLDTLTRATTEIAALRSAIERGEPLSIGRVLLLSRVLDGIAIVDDAW